MAKISNGDHVTLTADAVDLFPSVGPSVLVVVDACRTRSCALVAPLTFDGQSVVVDFANAVTLDRDDLRPLRAAHEDAWV